MEEWIVLLIPAILVVMLVRALLLPVKWFVKLGLHTAVGFACLWLLNLAAPITGVAFPINAATVLLAGVLGLPGIGGMALLQVL